MFSAHQLFRLSLYALPLLLLLLLLPLLHRLLLTTHRHFRFRRSLNQLPGPLALPLIGCCWLFAGISATRLHRHTRATMAPYSRVARIWLGTIGLAVLSGCEAAQLLLTASAANRRKSWPYPMLRSWLGDGLLTAATSATWLAHRRRLAPAFGVRCLSGFCEVFAERGAVLVERMAELVEAGGGKEPVPVFPLMKRVTLEIIAETAMGVRLAEEGGREYSVAVTEASRLVMQRTMRPWLYPDWVYRWSAEGRSYERCRRVMAEFTAAVIELRRAARRKEEGGEGAEVRPERGAFLDVLLDDPRLSEEEIRQEVETILLAGHDTTSASLSWTLWLLAHHTDIQERLHAEVQSQQGPTAQSDCPRSPTMRDSFALRYTECVLKESLRMYPALPIIGRQLSAAIRVAGHEIPAGTEVLLNLDELHRDERWFAQPQRFEPERFAPENMVGRPAFAYLPFSAGPRNCVGQKFAMLELKSLLCTLVAHFRFRVAEDSQLEDEARLMELIMKPARGVPLIVERRC